jgi:Ca2+-binding EF-hand superfamily protein
MQSVQTSRTYCKYNNKDWNSQVQGFDFIDANKDGSLTRQEISDFYTMLGSPLDANTLDFIVQSLDLDRSGKITLNDWCLGQQYQSS